MKRKRLTLTDLIKQNKEELLRDRDQLEMIEKRLDEKHDITKKTRTPRFGNARAING